MKDTDTRMDLKRKEIIDSAIMLEHLGLRVDWIKIAERLEKLQQFCPECGRKNLRA